MIYLFWEWLCVFLSKAKVDKKKASLFLLLLLWLLMAVRSVNLGINDTKNMYYYAFNIIKKISLNQALTENIFINEPLMTVFTWSCSKIMSFQVYIALCSLFPIVCFYKFICDNTNKPIYGVIIFFTLFYFYESFLVKQMLALSIVLVAFKWLTRNDFIRYAVLIILAGLIHKSALILIPIYFVCKYIKINRKFILITVFGIIFGLFFGQTILNLIYKFNLYNFQIYIRDGIYGTNGSITFSMFIYPIITIFCYFVLKNRIEFTDFNSYFCLMFIGCVLNVWSIVVVEFYRLALYFMSPVCILFPESIYNLTGKYKKIVTLISLLLFMGYAFKIAFNCNCLEYHTFLYDR